jgi:thiamine biosynthesis lipoprotein
VVVGARQGKDEHRYVREGVLGTSSVLVVAAADRATARKADAAVHAEVARLAKVLSTWQQDSELARLVAAGRGVPSADLAEVLRLALDWRTQSGGAFEPGLAALGQCWNKAAQAGAEPSADELASAVAALRDAPFAFHGDEVVCRGPVTLDAVAKGWIVDRAAAAVADVPGAQLVSFQIGGDMRLGRAPRAIALADPRQPADNAPPLCTVLVGDAAVASSGGYKRGPTVAGARHSHILDPRTGRPADSVLGCSVLAPDAATADALATSLCVLGPVDGFALLARTPGAHAVLVTADGAVHESPGFAARKQPEPPQKPAPERADAWPKGFVLQVDFAIKAPASGGRGRGGWKRPYVAVWVEDVTGAPAKTLALWIEDRKWLRDLRRWNRATADQGGLADLVSSATRKAGEYTLAWDGTDDDGRQLAPGRYIVCIEAAREHGTYQLMRQEIDLVTEPQSATIADNEEIGGAKLTFGKVGKAAKAAAK